MAVFMFGFMFAGCGGGGDEDDDPTIYTYTPEFFLSNVKDSKRYVKAEIVIELTREKDVTTLEERTYVLKDAVLGILRSKTQEELSAPEAQTVLAAEITQAIETELEIKSVHKIYFSSLIMQ